MKRLAALIFWFALVYSAHAQPVQQSGFVTPTHFSCFTTSGVIQDCGVAAQPFASTGGVSPGPWCVNSGPVTGAYQAFCLNANTTTGGILSIQNFGGAPVGGISFNINGSPAGLPIVITPTINGDFACFNNTTGTIIDCGTSPTGVVYGTNPSVVGNLVTWNNTTGTLLNTSSTVTGVYKWSGDQYFGSGRPWVDARSTANGTCAAAVGNGSIDDQPSLQCQANYLNSTFVGGTLHLSNGNYHLGSTLTIPNGVNIVCESNVSTSIGVGGTTDLTAITFLNSAVNAFIRNCQISGDTNSTATQNLVVVPTGANVSIYDSLLIGGNFALQNGGTDGVIFNTSIQGFGSSGGGVSSTGANWYIRAKIDQNAATAVGFSQGTNAIAQENHFIDTDISGAYTNSVVINDGGNHNAITTFTSSVFSSPIVITSASYTTISGAELGANVTANSGTVVVSASSGVNGVVTVSGSATTIFCGSLGNVTCPTGIQITPTLYGGTAVESKLTLQGTSNGSPSAAYLFLQPNGQFVSVGSSANPDVLLTINANSVATPVAPTNGTLVHLIGGNGNSAFFVYDVFGSGVSNIFQARSAGGTAASPSATAAATNIFAISAQGYDGVSAYGGIAGIDFINLNQTSTTDHSGYLRFRTVASGATSLIQAARIMTGVIIGSGTTDPGAGNLSVGGTISATLANTATTSAVCYNTSTGLFTYDGTIGTCNTSTIRVKHDVHPLRLSALDAVMKMTPVSYYYNADQHTPGQQLGFIAEDLEKIDPRLVALDRDGQPFAIRYLGPMFSYVVGAIHQLKADNDNLRRELTVLKRKIK